MLAVLTTGYCHSRYLGKIQVLCDPRIFLAAFAKLRKASVILTISVRTEQLGSHWTDFHEILY